MAVFHMVHIIISCLLQACQIRSCHTCVSVHLGSSIVSSRRVPVLYSCTLYWPDIKQLQPTNSTCVAGRLGRREGSAEEMDNLSEGSTLVLSARRRLPIQHNPRHVCADTQPRGLEEHCVLRSLHIAVVRTQHFIKRM